MTDTMHTDTSGLAERFFKRYASALLARDTKAIAAMYAVPSLIFPGQPIVVTDAKQTEEFFASSWGQYEGVNDVDSQFVIMGEAPGSIWAEVTWPYGSKPPERFCTSSFKKPRARGGRSRCSHPWHEQPGAWITRHGKDHP